MRWSFKDPENTAVFTTRQVLSGAPILRVTHDAEDGAWQFHSVPSKIENARVVALAEILDIDPSIAILADLPRGWHAERASATEVWVCAPLDDGDVGGGADRR